ncbi:RNA polymerase sigma-70 factor (ECF subfamily) [Nocardiopsis mwathae]|uniref:RNA polymerase sigma factor n=1 Tax=Nocardiopsis mwathae TaxID=1472723 RepID=A0A7W9YJZ0_9ACTN|nr:RNA polymerase sigma-70 factor (ECF subfamily) [Nocardiopsis mwathae]
MRRQSSPTIHRTTADDDLAEREEQLVRTLYQEFKVPLLRNVRQLTGGDQQWAEDVVQETVLRAWRHAPRLQREPHSLWAWLMTVARRIVIDDRRQRGIRPQEVVADRIDTDPPVPDGSEPTLSAMVVLEALRGLARHHREVLAHVYLRDLSVNETAETLGIPEGTVKSRMHYGLRRLRESLEEPEEENGSAPP